MSKLTGWWKNRSSAGKVELYTRWSFHLFVAIEILTFGLGGLVLGRGTCRAPPKWVCWC